MKAAWVVVLVAGLGCGEVKNGGALGEACAGSDDCSTGSCSDGVCCDRACNSECEACTASKTGGASGTCSAVTSRTDPDGECSNEGPMSCGASGMGCNGDAVEPACNLYAAATACGAMCTAGASTPKECDGEGACVVTTQAPVSCGNYACTADGNGCRTTCAAQADCASGATCNVSSGTCVNPLHVALEAGIGSCTRTESIPNVKAALEARGHVVSVVDGTQIDTAAEINAFDVVVIGAQAVSCAAPDYATFDGALGPFVTGGGGVVGTGWIVYSQPVPPSIASVMPVSGQLYTTGPQTMTPVGAHPIISGLAPFNTTAMYTPYSGTPKAGTTLLMRDAASNATGLAWSVGNGRSVFLAPIYIDSYANYSNQGLTDGTNPVALQLLMRSIEWAGFR